jgi:hypothetical protein
MASLPTAGLMADITADSIFRVTPGLGASFRCAMNTGEYKLVDAASVTFSNRLY